MSEKDKLGSGKVSHEGLFNFKDVYNFLYSWLADAGYTIEEKKYSEKIKEGKEIDIEWEAERIVTDYFRFSLKVKIKIMGMVPTEKKGLSKGSIEISIAGFLERDYESKWESTLFSKFMRGIYDKYVVKQKMETYEVNVYEEVDELIAQIKSFLSLEGRREA